MPRAALSDAAVADFRGQLCAVAERLFAERGYPGVTLRALAAELAVSPMTPYRYFRDKAAIFAAVRAAGFRRFADAQEATYAAESDPERRLRAMARSYLEFARREPHAYRIMFEMNPLGSAEEYPALAAEQIRGWEPLRRGVQAAIDAGLLEGDATHLAHVFWAAVHGIASLYLAGTYSLIHEDVDHIVDLMETTLFEGNRARRTRARAQRHGRAGRPRGRAR
ncbi:MAG TPA: TetR/AcrR family transcriptional regulator [Candidatus Limnocylindria bacterium]|nr:TetR/AcrR family transcriptional regulator [Candidatus Limnocylindria bacterium]